jgi:hypothetical protein
MILARALLLLVALALPVSGSAWALGASPCAARAALAGDAMDHAAMGHAAIDPATPADSAPADVPTDRAVSVAPGCDACPPACVGGCVLPPPAASAEAAPAPRGAPAAPRETPAPSGRDPALPFKPPRLG